MSGSEVLREQGQHEEKGDVPQEDAERRIAGGSSSPAGATVPLAVLVALMGLYIFLRLFGAGVV